MATINGTTGNDTLIGTTSADTLNGLAGDDTLNGLAGDDTLTGGNGNDTMTGGVGVDTFRVDLGTDTITDLGLGGADVLDVLAGATAKATAAAAFTASAATRNSGNKATITAAGFDVDMSAATGTKGYTITNANNGTKVSLTGSSFNDVLTGGTGADTLVGGLGNDTLSGGGGNDVLAGGAGNDTLTGGGGVDTASYADVVGPVTANLETGVATGDGNDTLTSIENLTGGTGNDKLTGNSAANVLDGGAGDDTLSGGSGNDTLIGGLGNDVLTGGNGTDTASYASATSQVNVNLATLVAQDTLGAGTDTLASIENLTGSAFNDTLIGSSANNILTGGAGDDVLDGGVGNDTLLGDDGNDTLTGGAGNDKLTGGVGNDTASYAGATSAVTVSLAVTTSQVTGGAGSDTLASIENLVGSAFNDTLTGDDVNNVLTGGIGNDTLVGGAGDDTLIGGIGNDKLTGGAGNDTFKYLTSDGSVAAGQADTITADAGDRLVLDGLGPETLDLRVAGHSLSGSEGDVAIVSQFGEGTNVLFNAGHFQIDLNNDGQFTAAQDFDIGLSGVSSVVYDGQADSFKFTIDLPPPPPPPPPPSGGMKIALTFDDGPWTYTQQVMDVLNQYNVDATFFVVGQEIAGREGLLQSMVANGHLVENHSWDHDDLTSLSGTALSNQFDMTSDAIFAATGTTPEYYRPPYGEHNATTDSVAASFGMQPVIWTVDTNDWATGATEAQIVNDVLTNATKNGVVLMHDGGGDRSATVQALDNIIEGLQQAGYEIVTLHEIPVLPVDWDGNTVPNNHYDLVA